MNPVLVLLRLVARLSRNILRALFLPVRFLFMPLQRFWPRRWFSRRSAAWASPPMAVSKQGLNAGLFSASTGRAAPQLILRPVNGLFIVFTLLLALFMNLLPWGNWHWMPDVLALALLFWISREPRLVGFGLAFIAGLLMDVHDGTVLGEHALSYVLLAYGANRVSKRLHSFNGLSQALHVWPILLGAQALAMVVKVFFGGQFPGWIALFVAPSLAALVWPLLAWLLLAPQRRPVDVDQNRPL